LKQLALRPAALAETGTAYLPAQSALVEHAPRHLVGLGERHSPCRHTLRGSGAEQTLQNVSVDQIVRVVEGQP
jgi:hypothetical protein